MLTYITDVIGTVRDENLELYRLEVSLAGKEQWRTISNAQLHHSPRRRRSNQRSAWPIRPHATSQRHLRPAHRGPRLQRQPKLPPDRGCDRRRGQAGDYTVSFTDLTIPLAGIPITIGRTYDTLNAAYSSDFGYGWRLDVGSPNIRESVRISASELAGAGSIAANPFREGTRVYMNTPDGRRCRLHIYPGTCRWIARCNLDTKVYRGSRCR